MDIRGGYKAQTVLQIANISQVFSVKKISLKAFRIYFACLVVVAAREAAERTRTKEHRQREPQRRFLLSELSRLTGCPLSRVRGELRSLERAGLLLFSSEQIVFTDTALPGSHELKDFLAGSRSPLRPVPLPRSVLRFLARCPRASVIQTLLAYAVRGLSLARSGEVSGKGRAKAAWIAEATGQSIRAVRSARAELIRIGIITADEGSKQWKLNRHGAFFEFNLDWAIDQKRGGEVIHNQTQRRDFTQSRSGLIVDNFGEGKCSNLAAPRVKNCANFAPPYKDKKTPYGSKYQGTPRADLTGVCRANRSEEGPNIREVTREDLGHFSRMEALYFQAIKQGLIQQSEANAVNFLAASIRAKEIAGDGPRVFMGIIKRQLWQHITQDQEQRAVTALKRFREREAGRFQCQ